MSERCEENVQQRQNLERQVQLLQEKQHTLEYRAQLTSTLEVITGSRAVSPVRQSESPAKPSAAASPVKQIAGGDETPHSPRPAAAAAATAAALLRSEAKVEDLRRELQESRQELASLGSQLIRLQDDSPTRRELDSTCRELDSTRRELEASLEELQQVLHELEATRSQLEATRHELASTRGQLQDCLQSSHDQEHSELQSVRREADLALSELQDSQEEMAALQMQHQDLASRYGAAQTHLQKLLSANLFGSRSVQLERDSLEEATAAQVRAPAWH